jgi:hemoglobin-like flavoprotein
MTPDQVGEVQASWAKVVPIAEVAADLFSGNLFDLDPELPTLFPNDLSDQNRKLMSMIGTAVAGLSQLDALVPAVQSLGQRHGGYGVQESHYGTVGAALLWTLEQGLGDAWNDELKEAWTQVYGVLSSTMIEASRQAAA